MITLEALAEELGLDTWSASLLLEEAAIYLPIGTAHRVYPGGCKSWEVEMTGDERRALPLSSEFADMCRERFAKWTK